MGKIKRNSDYKVFCPDCDSLTMYEPYGEDALNWASSIVMPHKLVTALFPKVYTIYKDRLGFEFDEARMYKCKSCQEYFVRCFECDEIFRTARLIPEGRKVRCPACNKDCTIFYNI